MSRIRLLYFLGAGPAAASRTDVAELFGKHLSAAGLELSWYQRSAMPGGPVVRGQFHGAPARLCGRSQLPGSLGRSLDKLKQLLAILHFFGHACTTRYDIIQVRDDFVAGVLGLIAARLRGVCFTFWLSFPFPESRLLDVREGRARSKVFSLLAGHVGAFLLYRVILPRADNAFVQSEQMKLDILRPGVDPAKLIPVPMGIPDDDLPDAVALPGDEPLVLYLGTLIRARRLELVVHAFAKVHGVMPQARLAIVGNGDVPEDRAWLESEVLRLGLQDVVKFTGQVRRDEALKWVQRAAVCLSPFYPGPLLRSASPTKLIEYMAFGKAVVANDQPPEQAAVMAASGAGICTPWDETAFARAITELLLDPQRRRCAGENGRRWVDHNRRYSRIAADVMRQYELVLARDFQPQSVQ